MNLQVVSGLLLYFGLGVLSDLLVTAYYIFVGKQWATLASLLSIPIALLNLWVIDKVLIITPSWDMAITYAIGNAIGCLAIMTLARKLREKKLKMPRFKTEEEFLSHVLDNLQHIIWGNHIVSIEGQHVFLDSKQLKVNWKKDSHLLTPMFGINPEDEWIKLLQFECCATLLNQAYPVFINALKKSLPSKVIGPDTPYNLGVSYPYFITLVMDDEKVYVPGHLICEAVDAGLNGEPLIAKIFLSQEGHPIQ